MSHVFARIKTSSVLLYQPFRKHVAPKICRVGTPSLCCRVHPDFVAETIEFTQNLCKTAGISLTVSIPSVTATSITTPSTFPTANASFNTTSSSQVGTSTIAVDSTSQTPFTGSAFRNELGPLMFGLYLGLGALALYI